MCSSRGFEMKSLTRGGLSQGTRRQNGPVRSPAARRGVPKVRYGNLTATEHALVQARQWQQRYLVDPASEAMQVEAYSVIVNLLGCFEYEQLQKAYRKAGIA